MSNVAKANRRLLWKLLLAVTCSFSFCFALIPLYRIACEKIFGIKLAAAPADAQAALPLAVDKARTVTVQFDAMVGEGLAWRFAPKVRQVKVHPGAMTEVFFTATNLTDVDLVGQAVPSIAPNTASLYFNKTECFCFTKQLLKGNEAKEMPVRFFVDPQLPKHINTLTLGYVFYFNGVAARSLPSSPSQFLSLK